MDFRPAVFFEALTSPAFITGVELTISLTVVSMVAGLGLGLLLALMRGSPVAAVRTVAWGYIWIFRAIPTLVQLLFVWDALPQLIPAFRGEWFSPFFAGDFAVEPNVSLIVSGGHTLLVEVRALDNYCILGRTVDDAAGEAGLVVDEPGFAFAQSERLVPFAPTVPLAGDDRDDQSQIDGARRLRAALGEEARQLPGDAPPRMRPHHLASGQPGGLAE